MPSGVRANVTIQDWIHAVVGKKIIRKQLDNPLRVEDFNGTFHIFLSKRYGVTTCSVNSTVDFSDRAGSSFCHKMTPGIASDTYLTAGCVVPTFTRLQIFTTNNANGFFFITFMYNHNAP